MASVEEMGDEDVTRITVCQGPPWCFLTGDGAQRAMRDNCAWCKRIVVDGYGMQRVTQPGSA